MDEEMDLEQLQQLHDHMKETIDLLKFTLTLDRAKFQDKAEWMKFAHEFGRQSDDSVMLKCIEEGEPVPDQDFYDATNKLMTSMAETAWYEVVGEDDE